MTACKVIEPAGRPQSPAEAAIPPIPARETQGRGLRARGDRARDTRLEGRLEGDPPGLAWAGPRSSAARVVGALCGAKGLD